MALNGEAGEVGATLDGGEFFRLRCGGGSIVKCQGAEDLVLGRNEWDGPAGAEPLCNGEILKLRPPRICRDVCRDDGLPGECSGAARANTGVR